ncbi:MAG: hypothetical protein JXL84_07270 [Deltaproteobacteria bacterium]|nr:hypothetical protein [Deltaproteobacteria bacterium]
MDPEIVYQIGVEPNRIDVLMSIPGVDFQTARRNRVPRSYDGVPFYVVGKADLIHSKRTAGRKQDLLDVERLEAD